MRAFFVCRPIVMGGGDIYVHAVQELAVQVPR